jgi:hypothetical protein
MCHEKNRSHLSDSVSWHNCVVLGEVDEFVNLLAYRDETATNAKARLASENGLNELGKLRQWELCVSWVLLDWHKNTYSYTLFLQLCKAGIEGRYLSTEAA